MLVRKGTKKYKIKKVRNKRINKPVTKKIKKQTNRRPRGRTSSFWVVVFIPFVLVSRIALMPGWRNLVTRMPGIRFEGNFESPR